MAINIFPQLQFRTGGGADSSGSTRKQVDPIQQAINLEQLQKLRKENQKMSQMDAATRTATVQELQPNDAQGDEMVPTGRTTFDPEVYQKELERVDPEKAAAYQTTRQNHEKTKLELEAKEIDNKYQSHLLPLKQKATEHDALVRAFDYGKATKWSDKKGLLSIINPYEEDPKDRTVDFKVGKDGTITFIQADGDQIPLSEDGIRNLNVSRDAQFSQYNEMKKWLKEQQTKASEQEINNATPIRNKYLEDANTKDYQNRGTQILTILAANKAGDEEIKKKGNKPGVRTQQDHAMTYGFIKILDSMTGVRDAEVAAVTGIPGVADWAKNIYNNLNNGGSLNDQQREGIINASKAIYKWSKETHDKTTVPRFEAYADAAKVRRNLVVAPMDFEERLNQLASEKPAKDAAKGKGKGAIGSEGTSANIDALLDKYGR